MGRDELVYMAKLAEQGERYDEMAQFMTDVASLGVELTGEERNLLSVAMKNVTGALRASMRMMQALEVRKRGMEGKEDLLRNYRQRIETELDERCKGCLATVKQSVLPANSGAESQVFFLKMLGDYNRYRCEYLEGTEKEKAANQSEEEYQRARLLAKDELAPTHPVALGLALNFSVFFYEVRCDPDRACKIAKDAFDAAISNLDHLDDTQYKDSTLIMQLLRDNLTLWTSSASMGADEEGEEYDE